MEDQSYEIRIADVCFRLRTRFVDTIRYFPTEYDSAVHPSQRRLAEDAETPTSVPETRPSVSPFHAAEVPEVSIPDLDWAEYIASGMEDCAHTEFSMLTPHFSDAMLSRDRVIVHGVAVRWHDQAYLICAASGTGKSTQARFLQELRPGAFSIICGDRPVLEFRPADPAVVAAGNDASAAQRPDEQCSPLRTSPATPAAAEEWSVLVHPSPWNGKENWHGADAAPLAGLILLERGEENRLASMTDKEAALPMYPHFIQTAWEADKIRKVAELETRLLHSVPIWKLTTHQVPYSTRVLLESVFTEP